MSENTQQAAVLNQQKVLRAYTALAMQSASAEAHGGKLVLVCGMGGDGIAAALGATLAGAACLALDADAAAVKLAMREGGCDFVVNSLDEALRILKNQVRKRRPVSVGVHGAVVATLASMVERGVQPEFVEDFLLPPAAIVPDDCAVDASDATAAQVVAMRTLAERGAQLLDLSGNVSGWFASGVTPAVAAVEKWATENGLQLAHTTAGSAEELRGMDAAALASIPENDWLRRRWLEQAPKYFRRQNYERWRWAAASEINK